MNTDATHDGFLDHPIIHGYVAMRIWGRLVPHLDVVAAEIRSRTQPGAIVFSLAMRSLAKELEVAHRLPDRRFDFAAPSATLIEEAHAQVRRRGLANVELRIATPEDPQLASEAYDIVMALYSVHYMEALESYWSACQRALRPGGFVLG